ncbi:hypothetical protein CO2235_200076 [Cupriavidus oxalaticus]|uniref:Uncharacterized protein n=1 Tax=Cupriavidus oxalaticus TaxID=96344 RepID=A0A976BCV2_9BURK|nr:hypothetical protein CO2235_200076 [Cupriavidus oxalaticus]
MFSIREFFSKIRAVSLEYVERVFIILWDRQNLTM